MMGKKMLILLLCLSGSLLLPSCRFYDEPLPGSTLEAGLQVYDSSAEVEVENDLMPGFVYLDYVELEYDDVSVRTAVLSEGREYLDGSVSGYAHGVSMSASLSEEQPSDAAERQAEAVSSRITSLYGADTGLAFGDPEVSSDYTILQGDFMVMEGNTAYPGIIICAAMPVTDNISLCFTVTADNSIADSETEAVLSEVLGVCGLSAG